ncbi:MAG: ABC transporter substrate-binding protein [Micrococcales bacterium]|nr:ABC transporter substrate-binding protein [Micrococcales bacterium]
MSVSHSPRVVPVLVGALAAGLALAACSVPAPPGTPRAPGAGGTAEGARAASVAAHPSELVLGDAQELGGYNPIRGYGELGVSQLYDGLLRLRSRDDATLPTLEPALAAAPPKVNADSTIWDVTLRDGVTFHDGSKFDAQDVVATYRAVLDPASASDIASSFAMIDKVDATSRNSVRFTLKYPYVDFAARLLLSIAASEKFTPGPAEKSTLNRAPVGTGPYALAELTPERAVFAANESYWGGAPQVKKLTTVYLPDDNSRAQRMAAGEIDGTNLPPALAATFASTPGMRVDAVQSADWRGVSLPANSAFAKDPAARIALNLAADRSTMVTKILAGHGRIAATPVSSVYGAAYAEQVFPHDLQRAQTLLDAAGWAPGGDGIRRKGAEVAGFTIAYNPTDTLRRDLATAFAADAKKVGVDVRLEALTFDQIEARIGDLGVLLGGGDKPYSIDTQVFGALHTKVSGASPWDNPGGFGTPARDAALERARRTADPAARAADYRDVQKDYLRDPSAVYLVFLDHTHVSKTDGWQRGPRVVEPHAHGVAWGPWWDLAAWKR